MKTKSDTERSIQMLVDRDCAAGKGHPQWSFLKLPNVIGKLDRVVLSNDSFVLDGEYSVQIVMPDGHEGGARFGSFDSELAIEFGNVGFA